MQPTYLDGAFLRTFVEQVLVAVNCDRECAIAVANGLVDTSLRGIDSHGIRLLPHYVAALKAGRINGCPNYTFAQSSPSTGVLDADHAYGHAATVVAVEHALRLAQEAGMGAVGVKNSSHFGAAACGALLAASCDMIGLSFTHATPLMKTPGAVGPFFGANPLACAAPMASEGPFCLDMSTTQITFNEVKLCRERGDFLEPGLAFDESGNVTLDPNVVSSLAPIGIYKGFGLSAMIDLFCGLLTGMPAGDMISDMYLDPITQKRFLGHFFIVIDIGRFVDTMVFKTRLQEMAEGVRTQRHKEGQRTFFPGDPEKEAWQERSAQGIPMASLLVSKFEKLANETGVAFLT